ncbi:MAG: ATP-binding protein, partial [Gemmatimonadaceae bacterium]|nr:ATP-binding protein [Gemmatimonadaceae bacterium]
DGRFVGFVGSVVDVHEQRLADERVRASLEADRARLEELFRRAPSFAVVYRGPEHRYEFVNDAYYQLIGHRDVLGRPIDEVVLEAREQGFTAMLDRVYATGEAITFRETPVWLERTPGAPRELRYVDMIFQALTDAEGRSTGVLAHGVDITDHVLTRREAERLLAVATAERERAEEANRVKGEFLATMSHELRTPLNAIGGHVQLLALGVHGPLAPAQVGALERVDRAQRHLLGLINDLLNYTKLDAGKVEYAMEPVDVQGVVDDVVPLVEPQLRAKGLTLEVARPRGALLAWADREKLGQVLVNLLSNAIKFTPAVQDDGRPGVVRIELSARGTAPGAVRLRVRDTGIGIPRAKQQLIFDPFVQLNAGYTTTTPGTGLGLAISRDLVRGMGGALRVQSVVGRGSCFSVTLRRSTPGETAAPAERPPQERRGGNDRRLGSDRRRGNERRRGRGHAP